jgi:hypothetical protein
MKISAEANWKRLSHYDIVNVFRAWKIQKSSANTK